VVFITIDIVKMGNFGQVNILVVLAGISAILPGQLALPEHPITSGHDSG
jgi:hypothetical protein